MYKHEDEAKHLATGDETGRVNTLNAYRELSLGL